MPRATSAEISMVSLRLSFKEERKKGRGVRLNQIKSKSKLTKITLPARSARSRHARPYRFNIRVIGIFNNDPSPTIRLYIKNRRYRNRVSRILQYSAPCQFPKKKKVAIKKATNTLFPPPFFFFLY